MLAGRFGSRERPLRLARGLGGQAGRAVSTETMLVMELVKWVGSGVVVAMIAVGWGMILLPGVVKRVRRDPRPSFPPVPMLERWSSDGALNVRLFCDAVRSVVPDATVEPGEDPDETRICSLRATEGVELSWVDSGSQAELGTVFVDLRLSRESYFELDLETYLDKAFWVVVGCLRDGVVSRRGRVWVHVREVGMWSAFSDRARADSFEPEWVTELPQ